MHRGSRNASQEASSSHQAYMSRKGGYLRVALVAFPNFLCKLTWAILHTAKKIPIKGKGFMTTFWVGDYTGGDDKLVKLPQNETGGDRTAVDRVEG